MYKEYLLRGKIAEKGFSVSRLARKIGITPRCLGYKIKNGRFYSDEIVNICEVLQIEDPREIFFAKKIDYQEAAKEDTIESKKVVKSYKIGSFTIKEGGYVAATKRGYLFTSGWFSNGAYNVYAFNSEGEIVDRSWAYIDDDPFAREVFALDIKEERALFEADPYPEGEYEFDPYREKEKWAYHLGIA